MVENTKVEYRTSWDERCLECLCAFANTDGGRMYVGVGEDACVVGVRDAAGLSAEISDGIRDALGIHADVRPQSEHGKEYVEISVCRSPRAVGYGGRVYLRRGKADRPVSSDELLMIAMREEPEITPERAAGMLGESPKDVKRRISRMKKAGKIRREGPAVGGRWIVL